MNYKTIFLGAVIGASIPNAHGMYQQGYNQSQYPQQRSNVSNNNNQPSYPNAPLMSPSNSIRPSNNNNANMPVAPNATNSNNPPPYAPSSQNAWGMDESRMLPASGTNSNCYLNQEDIRGALDTLTKGLKNLEKNLNDRLDKIDKRMDEVEKQVNCNQQAIAVLYAKSFKNDNCYDVFRSIDTTYQEYEKETRGSMPEYLADKVDNLTRQWNDAQKSYDLSTIIALQQEMKKLIKEVKNDRL